MLIALDPLGWLLATLRYFDWQDFAGMKTVLYGCLEKCLAARRIDIGLLATDTELAGDVVGGFRHRIGTELGFHLRIGEARTDGAVEGAKLSRVGIFRFGDHEGRATHALGTARDKQLTLPDLHCAGSVEH
ncbi:hypothetical protein D3C87_1658390 [compost metagenome]